MITEAMTPLHASLAALSASGLGGVGDHYTFQVDPAKSHVQYDVESSLGSCTLGPSSRGNLEGSLDLVLQPGVFPVSSGQESGGPCASRPALVGVVPNCAPGKPDLLRIGLDSLVITPHSQPFELDARGQFQAAFDCEISAGTLSVSLL